MQTSYYLKMLRQLRHYEEILLYSNILDVTTEEENEAASFLQKEYLHESLSYPHRAPSFNKDAALWGAKTVYSAAQLLLYRKNKSEDLEQLMPAYPGNITAGAMLSADLCLRFLPGIIQQLQVIDAEDKLIEILNRHLQVWHYSGIAFPLESDKLDFQIITNNKCLLQEYVNRVIANKRIPLAKLTALRDAVLASLGMYAGLFWNNLITELQTNE